MLWSCCLLCARVAFFFSSLNVRIKKFMIYLLIPSFSWGILILEVTWLSSCGICGYNFVQKYMRNWIAVSKPFGVTILSSIHCSCLGRYETSAVQIAELRGGSSHSQCPGYQKPFLAQAGHLIFNLDINPAGIFVAWLIN